MMDIVRRLPSHIVKRIAFRIIEVKDERPGARLPSREEITFPDSEEKGQYSYKCGYCGKTVAGFVVAYLPPVDDEDDWEMCWLQCPNCGIGSFIDGFMREIYPQFESYSAPPIEGVPGDVFKVYSEAWNCMSVRAFTGAELICRKILMNISVNKGAEEGKGLVYYVNYLEDEGYITSNMRKWVDLIRKHGNKAAHQIEDPDPERAKGTMDFTVEVLRVIYEMDYLAKRWERGHPST